MSLLLQGKVALVTGAGSGIGAATATAMAAEGAVVAVVDINGETGPETVAAIEQAGGTAFFHRTDTREEDDVRAAVDAVVERHGRLDCAVNCAGIVNPPARVADFDLAAWSNVVATNLTGVFLSTKHEIRQMDRQGDGGAIVNIASGLAQVAWSGFADYCATKGGVLQFTKVAALDYAAQGIRVNAILPGTTRTAAVAQMEIDDPAGRDFMLSQIPALRFGQPHEIAQAAVRLCSDRASFVTGAPFAIDGGTLAGPPAPGAQAA